MEKSRKELLADEYRNDPSPRNPRNQEVKTPSFLGSKEGKTQQETEATADYLTEKLKSPEHRDLFLRAAWRYPQPTLMRWLGLALDPGVKNSRAYFIGVMKKEGKYKPVGRRAQV